MSKSLNDSISEFKELVARLNTELTKDELKVLAEKVSELAELIEKHLSKDFKKIDS